MLPINGRIAIVDDQLSQAAPLIKTLSKNRLPHTYFSGEVEFLPDTNDNDNDIRILFLDINLIDNSEHENKVLKSRLIPVINRIISLNNYPYIIVYWSRHEHHKNLIEDDIFKNELKDKRPIGYLASNKSDFFDLQGNHTENFEENLKTLFEEINKLFENFYSYRILLNWENIVHKAADSTLQQIFTDFHHNDTWNDNSNCIISKLSNAYLGNYYKQSTPREKLTASITSFNSVFKDTLDSLTYNEKSIEEKELLYNDQIISIKDIVFQINEKLNLAKEITDINTPGNIIFYDEDTPFRELLNKILSLFKLKNSILTKQPDIEESVLKKQSSKEFDKVKDEIKKSWKKIGVIVTPICDYAQKNNHIYNRIVKGLLIEKKFKDFVDNNSEAIFIFPFSIKLDSLEYLIVLDFRYFTTVDISSQIEKSQIKYRVRQELLSEIQSKLSRHINRQGILFLD